MVFRFDTANMNHSRALKWRWLGMGGVRGWVVGLEVYRLDQIV